MTVRTSRHERQAVHDWRTIDAALRRSCTYRHPAGRIRRIETHISVVYLAGRHAYKINKPVKLSFADFIRPTTRQQCCEDEVRLNQRLAKRLYAGVVPLTRAGRTAVLGGDRHVIGHAVHMRRFDDGCLFSDLVSAGRLGVEAIERAADCLADFHRSIPTIAPRREYGSAHLFQAQLSDTLGALEGAGLGFHRSYATGVTQNLDDSPMISKNAGARASFANAMATCTSTTLFRQDTTSSSSIASRLANRCAG